MLTFFRRIRKGLLDSSQARKYILYAIGEIALVVIGILIALQINNWNEKGKELKDEKRILTSFHDELLANRASMTKMTLWCEDIQSAILTLLEEAASPQLNLNKSSVDTLIGMICWFNNSSTFEMSVSDAIIAGGKLSIINDEYLRHKITQWNRDVLYVTQNEKQDYDAFKTYWMPFLRKHAYLPQIANAITIQPGTGGKTYGPRLTLHPKLKDHSTLIRDETFQNVLLQRLWVMNDIIFSYKQLEPKLANIIEVVANEIGD